LGSLLGFPGVMQNIEPLAVPVSSTVCSRLGT